MSTQHNQIESVFVVSGIVGVLEKWVMEGCQTPGVSIAKLLNDVILKINEQ